MTEQEAKDWFGDETPRCEHCGDEFDREDMTFLDDDSFPLGKRPVCYSCHELWMEDLRGYTSRPRGWKEDE